jgi:chemotaxis protein MotB
MISLSKIRLTVMIPLSLLAFACGYSQQEWDQKVRENENLRGQLAQQEQARRKCDADHADAENEIAELKKQLSERGVDLDNLNVSLGQQKKALEEYAARTKQLDELKKRFEQLKSKLQKLTEYGLKVETRDNRMVIQLPGDVLFDSGSATLRKDGKSILGQVAEVVRSDAQLSSREFQVAGHTDAKPLRGGPFVDNWGLSAMRARTVVEFLTQPQADGGGGLDPVHLSAAGYADTDPVAANDTDENRKKNRRVELVIQPDVEEMLNLGSLTK